MARPPGAASVSHLSPPRTIPPHPGYPQFVGIFQVVVVLAVTTFSRRFQKWLWTTRVDFPHVVVANGRGRDATRGAGGLSGRGSEGRRGSGRAAVARRAAGRERGGGGAGRGA